MNEVNLEGVVVILQGCITKEIKEVISFWEENGWESYETLSVLAMNNLQDGNWNYGDIYDYQVGTTSQKHTHTYKQFKDEFMKPNKDISQQDFPDFPFKIKATNGDGTWECLIENGCRRCLFDDNPQFSFNNNAQQDFTQDYQALCVDGNKNITYWVELERGFYTSAEPLVEISQVTSWSVQDDTKQREVMDLQDQIESLQAKLNELINKS